MLEDDHDSADEYVLLAIGGTGADFFKARGVKLAYDYAIYRINQALMKYEKSFR